MTHLAVPGPMLIGETEPWLEPEHADLRDGTIWVDVSGYPGPAVLRALGERANPGPAPLPFPVRQIGLAEADLPRLLEPLLQALVISVQDLARRVETLEARLP